MLGQDVFLVFISAIAYNGKKVLWKILENLEI